MSLMLTMTVISRNSTAPACGRRNKIQCFLNISTPWFSRTCGLMLHTVVVDQQSPYGAPITHFRNCTYFSVINQLTLLTVFSHHRMRKHSSLYRNKHLAHQQNQKWPNRRDVKENNYQSINGMAR